MLGSLFDHLLGAPSWPSLPRRNTAQPAPKLENWASEGLSLASSGSYQCLPGALYAFAALEARSATALNSLPVQARAVLRSEIVPAAAAAISAAMMDSGSLASETVCSVVVSRIRSKAASTSRSMVLRGAASA
jgi:hypothetical protein